jgi:exodeoxyribonuclease V alpha subunit
VAWATEQAVPPADAALEALERAARAVSQASSEGHVCLPLTALLSPSGLTEAEPSAGKHAPTAPDSFDLATLRAALLGSGMVGTPGAPGVRPLILDPHDRLYLHRLFDLERRLAHRLLQAGEVALDSISEDMARHVRAQFPVQAPPQAPSQTAEGVAEPDWQAVAVGLALMRRLVVISGGPGTGKTTTLVKLLACLLEQNPNARIALAAPTGKAAARMTEALRGRVEDLSAPLRTLMPQESFTVHRLLGVLPDGSGFRHHADHPLPYDTLVVDEASMLDLALATRLLEALPANGRIVLLGDKDQLASVEAGAVFAELSRNPTLSLPCREAIARLCETSAAALDQPADPTLPASDSTQRIEPALPDSVIWLRRTYRFAADSGIGRLADCIRRGDASALMAALQANTDPSVAWVDQSQDAAPAALQQCLVAGWRPYLDALRSGVPREALFEAFERFRVLCAVREGPLGTIQLNASIATRIRAARGTSPMSEWYPGRAVMVLRNDYVLRRFNGDIGIALPDADGQFQVWFPESDQGLRAVSPARLPPHEDAFAMTVHKSQGSEFDAVAVVLPEHARRPASREQLYTAVTRARQGVTLCASAAALRQAVDSPTRRDSGLLARIDEQARLAQPGSSTLARASG